MGLWYVLAEDGKTAIPATEGMAGRLLGNMEARTVGNTTVPTPGGGKVQVSTVFLCLDHSFDPDEVLLWETMVFDSSSSVRGLDGLQERYSTWEEALAGHEATVAMVRAAVG